jgi:hypothetical protein
MTARGTEELIADLTADAKPVKPLASPMTRAIATLAGLMLVGVVALLWRSTTNPLAMRGAGAEWQAGIELATALLTGVLATVAAFHLAVPGRSRGWAFAALPAGALWLGVSGLGCWRDLVRNGLVGWEAGHSMDCLGFIMLASLAGGVPLAWRLSRAAPVDPVPVAALGGLGIAALSAFLLQFFHPFAVTFLDLAFHLVAISLVMIVAVLFRRPMLKPA